MKKKICFFVCGSRVPIYDNQMLPAEIINERRRRFNGQGCSRHNERIRVGDLPSRTDAHIFFQRLAVKHNIWLNHSAAVTAWNAFGV